MKERPRFRRLVTLLVVLAVLTSLCLVVNVTPVSAQVITAAPASGPAGTTVTVTTTTACPTGSVAYAIDFTDSGATTTQDLATGTLTAGGHLPGAGNTDTIVIPGTAAVGAGTITLWGAGLNGTIDRGGDDDTTTSPFTVTTATATFTPAAGPIGTVTTVAGTGWATSDTISAVTVGGVAATHTLTVDGTGAISGTITIPTVGGGPQDVVITGTTTPAQTFTNAFTVTTATATFIPASGPVGTVTTVAGTGWATSDTISAVTVGGVAATHTLTVDGTGAISGTITIPTVGGGPQDVVITGTTTPAQTFTNAFTVTNAVNSVTPNPATASDQATYTINVTTTATYSVGDTITITFPLGTGLPSTISKTYVTIAGAGFAVGEPQPVVNTVARQVIITVGNTTQATAMSAATFDIVIAQGVGITNPAIAKTAASGAYPVSVSTSREGLLGTLAGYEVLPSYIISPTRAVRLQPVTVSGKGWTPLASIAVPLGGVLSGSGTALADGTFSFVAWPVMTGALTIIDGAGQTQAAPWVGTVTQPTFTLLPKISLSPATANVGSTVTLTGFDFTGGGTIIAGAVTLRGAAWSVAPYVLATVDSWGAGLDDIPVGTTLVIPRNQTPGATTVVVTDDGPDGIAGNADDLSGTATLTVNTPTVTINPASGPPGTQVIITGTNFGATDTIGLGAGSVTVGGAALPLPVVGITVDASGGWVLSGTIPAGAAPGMNALVALTDSFTSANTGFTVSNRVLTLSPDSGPVGTRVSIGGANMSTPTTPGGPLPGGHHQINLNLATFAGAAWNTTAAIPIDSLGNISPTTLVVPGAGTGAQTVAATDTGGAIASGTFTVTQPTISLDKTMGYRGDTITLTGSGWLPGSLGLATITFAGATILTATPDANGDITALFVVPAAAAGVSLVGARDIPVNIAASQTFTLLPTAIIVDPTSGPVSTTVSITGVGFQPQTGVTTLSIGGASIMPRTPIVTDTTGGFTATFTVPGLAQVAQTVSVTVAGLTATTAFTISIAPPSVAGATAGISAQLVRVWGYAAGAWEMYDPADVPGSDLASLTPGRGYWVKVTEDVRLLFAANSYDLTGGWNLIGWR